MDVYGGFTRGVPVNVYAIARDDSLVDYGNYVQTLGGELEFIEIERLEEFGLRNVEGAVLTGERHILVNRVREYFEAELGPHRQGTPEGFTIDCTFCALEREGVDRYEPCVTYVLEGDYNTAVTIMDGPFPSVYPHYEPGYVSLTSALHTPLSRQRTYQDAQQALGKANDLDWRRERLLKDMERFYPAIRDYKPVEALLAIRAMPVSGADSRLMSVKRTDRGLRVMAGKIDAIFEAADTCLSSLESERPSFARLESSSTIRSSDGLTKGNGSCSPRGF